MPKLSFDDDMLNPQISQFPFGKVGVSALLCCLVFFASIGPVVADTPPSHQELEAMLRSYQGTWEGTFVVSSVETGVEQTLEVRQIYWWDGEGLRGVGVFTRDGDLNTARSFAMVDQGRLYSQVEQAGEETLYRGFLFEEGIIWRPADEASGKDRQMREWVDVDTEPVVLRTSGFETRTHRRQTQRLLYRGALTYVGPANQ